MKIDKDKFLFQYINEYGTLNDSRKQGLAFLLLALEADTSVKYVRWAAYMLATVKHECGGEWQPIREYSRGKGYKYGKVDPVTKQIYYGRGYVQLTWKYNYESMGKVCKADLVNQPDLVLNHATAYRIMSHGMRNGSFTGAALSKFIHEKKCDYINARKIINGLDCAVKIAEYAVTIERMLRNCVYDETEFKTLLRGFYAEKGKCYNYA